MNIFTRRNALVGYLALRALRRARRNAAVGYLAVQGLERARPRRRGRRALKISMYAALGIVSVGLLAGLAYWRRQVTATEQATEEAAEAGEAAADAEAPAAEQSEAEAPLTMEPASAT